MLGRQVVPNINRGHSDVVQVATNVEVDSLVPQDLSRFSGRHLL